MKYQGIPVHEILIHKHPLIFFSLVKGLLVDAAFWFKAFFLKQFFLLVLLTIISIILFHVSLFHPVQIFLSFVFYWIILGVASSIGLGTGLHTFVLYLGPHIAKLAIISTTCGYIPEMIPNRWEFDHFAKCETMNSQIGFFQILFAVQLQSFLWGFGTVLGELPPYFIAKKAAETSEELFKRENEKEKDLEERIELVEKTEQENNLQLIERREEINQIRKIREKQEKTLVDRLKIKIHQNLQKYGFITILLCASVPNPFFDIAGITCGHFRISFKKFFLATFIGKAIIKVHLQMIFVITVFRQQTLNAFINFAKRVNENWTKSLQILIEAKKQALYNPPMQGNESSLSQVWDLVIILMVGYFLLSIINSKVQEKAMDKEVN